VHHERAVVLALYDLDARFAAQARAGGLEPAQERGQDIRGFVALREDLVELLFVGLDAFGVQQFDDRGRRQRP
jgi:hypothetical protein